MSPGTHNRITLLGLVVFGLAVLVGARLFDLQVVRSDSFRERAAAQHLRPIEVAATRGAIVDRHDRAIASSLATEALYAHPPNVKDAAGIARKLAGPLGQTETELLKKLTDDESFVFLDRFCEPEVAAAVRRLDLPVDERQLGFLPSSRRYYPREHLGVHVVGFTDVDGKGIEGIELVLDHLLRGDPTRYLLVQDARKGGLRELVQPPTDVPHDVVLSLDLVLQYIVERELDRLVRELHPLSASAVLLDPTTGQILAMANRPTIDPNRIAKASVAARRNRAVVDQYEPGSTFKIVPMAAALESGTVRPHHEFDCEHGSLRYKAKTIRDSSSHGVLTAGQVMSQSSNIGMVKIGERISAESLFHAVESFGFGHKTGVELPGEFGGTLRPTSKWDGYTKANLSFGQGIGVTVLQMASAFATIATEGLRFAPNVVLGIRDIDGRLQTRAVPEPERVVSSQTARQVTAMLEEVMTEGTGARAQVPGYRLAGKSGTAQKPVPGGYSPTEYVASFGGFGPIPEPRIVGLVVIDSPEGDNYHGGQAAAPVFGRIMTDALRYMRVPPQGAPVRVAMSSRSARPAVYAPGTTAVQGPPARRVVTPGDVPDVSGLGLRQAILAMGQAGYYLETQGSGVVLSQEPAPGSSVAPGTRCRVILGEPDRGVVEEAPR